MSFTRNTARDIPEEFMLDKYGGPRNGNPLIRCICDHAKERKVMLNFIGYFRRVDSGNVASYNVTHIYHVGSSSVRIDTHNSEEVGIGAEIKVVGPNEEEVSCIIQKYNEILYPELDASSII
ncbi:hypothetical protein CMI47_23155 [Candidatus Pacearchaeota archaeon]|nr:hypothetical protein [Candidatus Pacearchaeota archaeon]|tara:strand:+ start:3937 stop:4302 length:366 start_codon:yes stop_codon:yes gene_type:complete